MRTKLQIAILSIVVCTMVSGCFRSGPVELVGGYFFFSPNPSNHYILKGTRVVIYTNVVDYEVADKWIIGKRELSIRPDMDPQRISDQYGFFILDTETGALTEGVKESELDIIRNGPSGQNSK